MNRYEIDGLAEAIDPVKLAALETAALRREYVSAALALAEHYPPGEARERLIRGALEEIREATP